MKFNKLVPEFSVSIIKKSLYFYNKILGFKIEYERKESGFAFLSFQGSQIMLDQIKKYQKGDSWETGKMIFPFGRGINFQIEVKNVVRILNSLKKNHWPIKMPLKDSWYEKGKKLFGCREFLVMDPDGYLLRFSQDLGTKSKNKQACNSEKS